MTPDDPPTLVGHLGSLAGRPFDDGEFAVHALPVGSGQATLVRTAESTLLFDGGPDAKQPKPAGPYGGDAPLLALRALGVDHLDHVVISHLDADHIGGLEPVFREYGESQRDNGRSLGAVHLPETGVNENTTRQANKILGLAEEALDAPTELVAAFERRARQGMGASPVDDDRSAIDWRDGTGDPLDLGDGVTATFLSPVDEATAREWHGDEGSAVLHVGSEPTGRAALLTGDIHGDPVQRIVLEHRDRLADVDWLDVPDHCSGNLPRALLDQTDPELSVIPHSGEFSPNGHFPSPAGVFRLNEATDAGTLSPGRFGVVSSRLDAAGVTTTIARNERQRHEGGRVVAGLTGEGRERLLDGGDAVPRFEAGARPSETWTARRPGGVRRARGHERSEASRSQRRERPRRGVGPGRGRDIASATAPWRGRARPAVHASGRHGRVRPGHGGAERCRPVRTRRGTGARGRQRGSPRPGRRPRDRYRASGRRRDAGLKLG